jgi:hypothetical protein
VLAKGLRIFAPPLVGSGLAAGTGGEGLDLTTREAQILTTLELVVSTRFEAAALVPHHPATPRLSTGTSPWPIQKQL